MVFNQVLTVRRTPRVLLLLLFAGSVRANVATADNLLSALWPPGAADALWFSDLAGAADAAERPALPLVDTAGDPITGAAPEPDHASIVPPIGEYAVDTTDMASLALGSAGRLSSLGYFREDEPQEASGSLLRFNADPPEITFTILGVAGVAALALLFRRTRSS